MSAQIPLPTVDLFTSELESVGPKWYDLGIFLGISTHELDVIGEYHGSKGTQRCLIELFKCFQSRTKPVTWNDITDGLTKIHNNYLADRIRDKYIRTVSSSYPLSPPRSEKQDTGSDSQIMETAGVSETHDDRIHHNVQTASSLSPQSSSRETTPHSEELEDEKSGSDSKVMETGRVSETHDDHIHHNVQTASSLSPQSSSRETTPHSEELEDEKSGSDSQVMETGRVSELHDNKHIYIDKSISNQFYKISTSFTSLVLKVKQALQRKSVSVDDLQDVLQDQCKLEPLSTEVATFQKVFARVRQHYCFLNYHILAYLVDMFLSDEKPLQQLLENYTNKLEKFKESMMMKDLMKLIKQKRDLCGNHKIIELKTRDFWGSVVLNKFEKLAMLVFQNIYDCAAQIRIEDGCICVSWVIPDIDTSVLDTVSPDLLKVVGVISLKIDDKVLYEGANEGCHIMESAFLQAVELGNVIAVELLLAVSTCEVANLALYNGVTPLMVASYNGHSVVVSTLLTSGADSNMANSNGWTPLMIGSQNGHSVVVSTLLTSGADPNRAQSDGWTPLMIGSQNGHNEVVEVLLQAKVNPNACNNNGATAIYIASGKGHSVVVSTLLTSGADPNMAKSDGWTPLMIGSHNGHNEVVEVLLQAKVNPNACNNNGATAIYIASGKGHSVVVSTLLTSCADPNMAKSDGWTPLMIGTQNGHNEVVEILLKAKVNPNACNNNGATAIYIASENGHSVVVSTLLTSGADPNIAESDGWTPLMIGSQNGHSVVVSILLTSGADPNIAKSNGWTPLMIGSHNGDNEVVEILLKAEVNPNACLKDGATAIYTASGNGHSVVVSTLLTSGADPNIAKSNGWTPLMIGSQKGHNEVVEILLKAKVNPNACLKDGTTAIYIASQNGHSVVVSTLLTSGADPNMANSNGWIPLMIGSQNDHNEVVEVLLKAKVNPNTCSVDGTTAIYIASENGHSVVVSTLLTSGADPNRAKSNGWTPLMIASGRGHSEVVKQLIKADVNINYQAVAGITALHLASQYGHIDIVKILLESGADSRLFDSKGMSPLDFASGFGHHDIVKLLYEFRPLVGSISQLTLTSISTVDTGFYGSEDSRSIITELSGYSAIEDDVISLVSNPVTTKPNERK